MKKIVLLFLCFQQFTARAQLGEAEQLLLNIEKLAQLRSILQNMYDGYQVLYRGYTSIRDISQGNFSLHKTFLDALLQVSPAVRNYYKVYTIITSQAQLRSEYQQAWQRWQANAWFHPDEMAYMAATYRHLLRRSKQLLEDLLAILTAGRLRMNDEQRLAAIDHLCEQGTKDLAFLKTFNHSAALLARQRQQGQNSISELRKLYGLTQ